MLEAIQNEKSRVVPTDSCGVRLAARVASLVIVPLRTANAALLSQRVGAAFAGSMIEFVCALSMLIAHLPFHMAVLGWLLLQCALLPVACKRLLLAYRSGAQPQAQAGALDAAPQGGGCMAGLRAVLAVDVMSVINSLCSFVPVFMMIAVYVPRQAPSDSAPPGGQGHQGQEDPDALRQPLLVAYLALAPLAVAFVCEVVIAAVALLLHPTIKLGRRILVLRSLVWYRNGLAALLLLVITVPSLDAAATAWQALCVLAWLPLAVVCCSALVLGAAWVVLHAAFVRVSWRFDSISRAVATVQAEGAASVAARRQVHALAGISASSEAGGPEGQYSCGPEGPVTAVAISALPAASPLEAVQAPAVAALYAFPEAARKQMAAHVAVARAETLLLCVVWIATLLIAAGAGGMVWLLTRLLQPLSQGGGTARPQWLVGAWSAVQAEAAAYIAITDRSGIDIGSLLLVLYSAVAFACLLMWAVLPRVLHTVHRAEERLARANNGSSGHINLAGGTGSPGTAPGLSSNFPGATIAGGDTLQGLHSIKRVFGNAISAMQHRAPTMLVRLSHDRYGRTQEDAACQAAGAQIVPNPLRHLAGLRVSAVRAALGIRSSRSSSSSNAPGCAAVAPLTPVPESSRRAETAASSRGSAATPFPPSPPASPATGIHPAAAPAAVSPSGIMPAYASGLSRCSYSSFNSAWDADAVPSSPAVFLSRTVHPRVSLVATSLEDAVTGLPAAATAPASCSSTSGGPRDDGLHTLHALHTLQQHAVHVGGGRTSQARKSQIAPDGTGVGNSVVVITDAGPRITTTSSRSHGHGGTLTSTTSAIGRTPAGTSTSRMSKTSRSSGIGRLFTPRGSSSGAAGTGLGAGTGTGTGAAATSCCICFDAPCDAVFLECGHAGCCYACAVLSVRGLYRLRQATSSSPGGQHEAFSDDEEDDEDREGDEDEYEDDEDRADKVMRRRQRWVYREGGSGRCPLCRAPVTQIVRVGPDTRDTAGRTVALVLHAAHWAHTPPAAAAAAAEADVAAVGDRGSRSLYVGRSSTASIPAITTSAVHVH